MNTQYLPKKNTSPLFFSIRHLVWASFITLIFPIQALSGPLPSSVQDSDFHNNGQPIASKVELGKLLFFDKLLSGNGNISCATCHHPLLGTGDGLSLPVGEGGAGIGPSRNTGDGGDAIFERVPRNAPPIFNLGAVEFIRMFHDGRVEVDTSQPSGFKSPAGSNLPLGLDNVLAAQAMFPVTSAAEMAGSPGDNIIADFAAEGDLTSLWSAIAQRLQANPEYVRRFNEVYGIEQNEITYVHAANAMAAFEADIWRFDKSPFDRFLRGETDTMSENAKAGMQLFYGGAKCDTCHSGKFQTDHKFHSIGMPQIGPGKGDGNSSHEDFGRERETANPSDRYKFRTPSLRNVELSGPWGHAGAYNSLEAIVRHHANPQEAINSYNTSQAVLPSRTDLNSIDFLTHNDTILRALIADSNEILPTSPSDTQVQHMLDFLGTLTDPAALDMRDDFPKRVPSGLPIFETSNNSCFKHFGNTNRFVMCEQTNSQCTFLADTGSGKSCDSVCESNGGFCMAAHNDKDDTDSCEHGSTFACSETSKADQLCTCGYPSTASTNSCFANHGTAPGFLLCRESNTECEMLIQTGGETCRDYCQSQGGACIDAWNDDDGTCGRLNDEGCDAELDLQICNCSKTNF